MRKRFFSRTLQEMLLIMKHRFIQIFIFFIALVFFIAYVHSSERQSSINDYFDLLGDKLFEGGFDFYQLNNIDKNDYLFITPLEFDMGVVPESVVSIISENLKPIFLKAELRFSDTVKVIDGRVNLKKTLTLNGEIKREKDNYHVMIYLVDNTARRISQAEERLPISLFQKRKLFMTLFDPAGSIYHKDDRVVRNIIKRINQLLVIEGFIALDDEASSTGRSGSKQGRVETNNEDFVIRFSLYTSKDEPSVGELAWAYTTVQISALLSSTRELLAGAEKKGEKRLRANPSQEQWTDAYGKAAIKAVDSAMPELIPLLKETGTGY